MQPNLNPPPLPSPMQVRVFCGEDFPYKQGKMKTAYGLGKYSFELLTATTPNLWQMLLLKQSVCIIVLTLTGFLISVGLESGVRDGIQKLGSLALCSSVDTFVPGVASDSVFWPLKGLTGLETMLVSAERNLATLDWASAIPFSNSLSLCFCFCRSYSFILRASEGKGNMLM